jgi:hypothetical protein
MHAGVKNMMKQFAGKIRYGLILGACSAILVGCEWESSGSDSGYNTSRIKVSVAGVYRAPVAGDPLVVDFRNRGSDRSTTGSLQQVRGESIATGNGARTSFSGRFSRSDILPGSVQINGAGYSFSDNGTGILTGEPAGVGRIVYTTGAWSIDFRGIAPSSGSLITGNYTVIVPPSSSTNRPGSGASRTTIFQFNVQQVGNKITIVDNNGDSYEGALGGTRIDDADGEGDILRNSIQFKAEGVSRGIPITITGKFNADVASNGLANGTNSTVLVQPIGLTMDGSWIEPRGAGDVFGVAR